MRHNFRWEWNGLSWRLANDAGVKVWLVRKVDLTWQLHLGDMNSQELPAYLEQEAAKRMAVGKVVGYLNNMAYQLDRLRGSL